MSEKGPRSVADTRLVLVPLVAAVGAIGWLLGGWLPILGPAVLALFVGVLARAVLPLPADAVRVAPALGTRLLQLSIVALGLSVDIGEVLRVAGGSLPVMLATLAVGLGGIWLLGRVLAVPMPTRGLLMVGTSICGASAIAAVAPVLAASGAEIAYAVSVIFLFNITAVVAFPTIAHALGFAPDTFAIWAGTAVNDTSSVLAAAFAFGSGTATYAAVVKLSRTLMILPVTVLFAALGNHGEAAGLGSRARVALRRALPWFIVAFVVASAVDATGIVPAAVEEGAATLARIGTVLALASVGLGTQLGTFRRTGPRPLLLGLAGWLLVAVSSLVFQSLTGQLTLRG